MNTENVSKEQKGNDANRVLGAVCSNCGIVPKSKQAHLATGEFSGYWFGCICKHEIRLMEKDAKLAYFK